jgi:hypothetical protein
MPQGSDLRIAALRPLPRKWCSSEERVGRVMLDGRMWRKLMENNLFSFNKIRNSPKHTLTLEQLRVKTLSKTLEWMSLVLQPDTHDQ